MVSALLIALREGLEAALVIGIVLGVLRRLGRVDRSRAVWFGVVAAIVASIIGALVLNGLGIAFEGRGEEIFEGIAMLLAAGVLTWMIFWMRQQGKATELAFARDAEQAAQADGSAPLFWLAFVAVFREGMETALFLTAAAFSASAGETLVGTLVGLLVAVAIGWLVIAGSRQLPLRAFFRWTGVLLLLVAAGLVAHGIYEFQEAGIVPVMVEHVWDVNALLDENSAVGGVLKALFGYNGNPSLLEVVGYVAFLALVAVGAAIPRDPKPSLSDREVASSQLAREGRGTGTLPKGSPG